MYLLVQELNVKYQEDGFAVDVAESHPLYEQIREMVRKLVAGEVPRSKEEAIEAMRAGHVQRHATRLYAEVPAHTRYELHKLSDGHSRGQVELEGILKINAHQLRARHAGLAKVCKRLGLRYPIASTGVDRDDRRFTLDPMFAEMIRDVAASEFGTT
jgi:hypothetical protein